MASNTDSCNADELAAPKWLNADFMKGVLDDYLKQPGLKVVDIKLTPASSKGDHYASVMFRAAVEYTSSVQKDKSTISLIIKTMPEQEGQKKELLGESHIFQTEIAMYTKILPLFESILRKAGEKVTLCADCLYHSLEPRQVMVFEDLVSKGYSIIRRSANLDELQAVLDKLAKWHAVSHKLLKEQPELFKDLSYDLTTLPHFLEQDLITTSLGNFIDMLGNVESLKRFQKYFEPMRDHFIQRWVDVIREYRNDRKENGYYVLCHGDFHLRNMMFKGLDCMLLDFQMSYVGSMANDIIYAIYMLFDSETRKEKSNELIYNYFETFSKTLKKIGYNDKIPCLVEFRRQMFDKRYNDILLLVTFQPFVMQMRKGADPAQLSVDAEQRRMLYYQKEYQDELKDLLPRMLHLGYFEPLKYCIYSNYLLYNICT